MLARDYRGPQRGKPMPETIGGLKQRECSRFALRAVAVVGIAGGAACGAAVGVRGGNTVVRAATSAWPWLAARLREV